VLGCARLTGTVTSVQVLTDDEPCPDLAGSVVTIGAYDGVHLGHQAVIESVRARARERGLISVVVTFDRHPASVVRPEAAPLLLNDLDQKLELLASTGIDLAFVVRFTRERAAEPAEQFVRRVLTGCLGARVVVVGDDFHFGAGRQGNVTMLETLGPELGFDVSPLRLVGPDGALAPSGTPKVSSTAVRAAVSDGDVARAASLLGRHHEVRGVVGHGDKRARVLGFPTANVEVPEGICLPADGIYAAWYVDGHGAVHPAAISLGRRPTFYDDQPYSLLEAHLLDVPAAQGEAADGTADDAATGVTGGIDLYGQPARVRFVERLRDEQRFDSVDALVTQMGRDCDRAREVLAAATP
jgi:riboflavin kinase / FMN adenylyltransferase